MDKHNQADELENKTDSSNDPNKTLSPEDIAKLFASQAEPEAAVEATDKVAETNETVETTVPESVAEVESNPIKTLSPEEIAKLFASLTEPEATAEEVEEVAKTVETVEPAAPEPAAEAEFDPNKMLSPDDIAKLFASQTEPEAAEEVADTVEIVEPEPLAETVFDPNKTLSPDDIAKLFASQTEPEAAAEEAEEVAEMVETDAPEPVVDTEIDPNKTLSPEDVADTVETVEPEPVAEAQFDPNKMLSPDDIANLFASQSEPEAAAEAPEVVAETAEMVETDAPEPIADADFDPNKMLSPDDIAKLVASQTEPDVTAEEVEEVAEMVEPAEPEAVPEPESAIVQESTVEEPARLQPEIQETLEAEQVDISQPDESQKSLNPFDDAVLGEGIAADTVPDQTVMHEKVNLISLLVSKLKGIFPKKKTPPVANDTTDAGAAKADKNKTPNFIGRLIGAVKKPLSKKQTPSIEDIATEVGADTPDKKEKSNFIGKFIGAIKKSLSKKQPSSSDAGKESKNAKAARSNENAADNPVESVAIKESPKSEKPRKKSGLKTALAIIGVLLLMTGSFTAGFFVRDYNMLPGKDPAELKAEAEAKAKKAQDEQRAEELAKISPKDYTSSMYLDSLILKGKAEKIKTIKLKKIDNVSKLTEFPNLRKIKFDGMTGDEDLSVIQKLNGLEEISIESSVIRNQFKNGSFGSVTYLEMYDSTVEDSTQFANFKGLTELYAYATQFPSTTGNLELTAYLPAAQSITLSNCGNYEELAGAKSLNNLNTLNISGKTLIRNMSYTENPHIEILNVDVSLVENPEQLQRLADLQNIKSVTIQADGNIFSSSQLRSVKELINMRHPEATVKISTY